MSAVNQEGSPLGCLAIIVIIVGCIALIVDCGSRSALTKNFKSSHLRAYGSAIGLALAANKDDESRLPIRGSYVALGPRGKIHRLYHQFPDDLRANAPEDVGAILLIIEQETTVGRYRPAGSNSRGGGEAVQVTMHITVITPSGDRVVKQAFSGKMPEQIRGSSFTAWPDDEEIFSWLRRLRLPRRPPAPDNP